MTKKYIATYADAKGNLKRVSEPFYGDFNERMLQKMIAGKRPGTRQIGVFRVTGGHHVLKGTYDVAKDQYYPANPPAGSRMGPGYY